METATQLPAIGGQAITPRLVYDLVLSRQNANTVRAYRRIYDDFAISLGYAPSAKNEAAVWVESQIREAIERSGGQANSYREQEFWTWSALIFFFGQPAGTANAMAAGYRAQLEERGLKANSINLHLAALRSIVKEANRFGLIPWKLDVRGLKTRQYRDTSGPGHENYRQMIAKITEQIAERQGIDPAGRRDLAIVRLLYDNGLRCKEVAGMDLKDVDFANGTVSIIGKGHTEHDKITVPAAAMTAIKEWVALRGSEPGPLWRNLDGVAQNADRRLSKRSVYCIVTGWARKCGFQTSPHRLRHGGITRAARLTNGNAIAVKAFSRHARLDTVQIYIDADKNLAGQVARLVGED